MSRTLAQTIAWSQTFVNYLSLTIGTNNEPAISNANHISQIFLSPDVGPWSWNRSSITFTTAAGTQDYSVYIASASVPIFGWLETATLKPASGTTFQIKDVKNTDPLAESSDQARPNAIAVQKDDGAGNITFRFMGLVDATYTCTVNFQMAAQPFVSTSSTWSPIPDRYAYIYERGFLAETLEPVDAQRSLAEKQRFVMSLVSIAEGMELADKAIFIAQYLNIDAAQAANMLGVQSGNQAKGQR
jgi:hypothetical protein